MALKCEFCGKAPHYGNVVSHANNTRRRRWNPNLKRLRAVVAGGGERGGGCAACIPPGEEEKKARGSRPRSPRCGPSRGPVKDTQAAERAAAWLAPAATGRSLPP